MSMMICIHTDSEMTVTETLSHGANGMSGLISARFGDISLQLDESTAEQLETAIAASREKLRVARAKRTERRVAA